MKLSKLVIIALFASLVTGCAQYEWRKDGATAEAFHQDDYACQIEANNSFPVVMVSTLVRAAHFTPPRRRCEKVKTHNQVEHHCFTVPGHFVPAEYGMVDANASNRSKMKKQCLYARGWERVRVE